MKKVLTLALAVIMTVVLTSVAMASTIGFVSPGACVDLAQSIDPSGDLTVTGLYGFNDKVLVKVAYTDSDPDAEITLGGRYAFTKDFVVTLDYASEAETTSVGFRARTALNDKLTLASILDYNTDAEITALLAQAEFKVTDTFVANAGVQYTDAGDDFTAIVVGGEFTVTKNIVPYFDYAMPTDSEFDNTLSAGVSLVF
jgi:predicted porin